MSTHAKAAAKFLADRERAAWHDRALYHVREKRDRMAHAVPEWEALRQAASEIKLHTLSHLGRYLEEFERNATANGMVVHWASDAREMNRIVLDILRRHGGRTPHQEQVDALRGVRPRALPGRTGDRCRGERPGRADHAADAPSAQPYRAAGDPCAARGGGRTLRTGTRHGAGRQRSYLPDARGAQTFARQVPHGRCRHDGRQFRRGLEGAFAVCTNEGNADLGTSFPDLHIAIMGLEKVVPDYRSLAVFTRLLARSATGQPVTAYTSLYRRPEPGKQIHVVIVDNGRTESLRNEAHRNMLKCLRCGACMNTCPVYRRSGGYSYSYFIPGPLGINLGMLRSPERYAGNVSGCSLCYSCSNVCPARIDLGEQIYAWRQEMDADGVADTRKKLAVEGMDVVMRHKALFYTGLKLIPWVPRFVYNNRFNPWCAAARCAFRSPEFQRTVERGKNRTEKKEKR